LPVSAGVHRIRLRRPWACRPGAESTAWRRRFGCPTGIGPRDQVHLCFAGFSAGIAVSLNGRRLGHLPPDALPGGFNVTGALAARNEIELEIHAPLAGDRRTDEPPGEVALEIRPDGNDC
jgi:hypothetical protein